MTRIKPTAKTSPPPSPSTLLKAQIIITKAAQEKAKEKAKARKAEKENKGKKGKSDKGKVATAFAAGKVKRTISIS
jgi:hypothetical protein